MYRRLAIVSSLLLILWASVACSTKPVGENAESSAASHIFGSEQVTLPAGTVVTVCLVSYGVRQLESLERTTPQRNVFIAAINLDCDLNGRFVCFYAGSGEWQLLPDASCHHALLEYNWQIALMLYYDPRMGAAVLA